MTTELLDAALHAAGIAYVPRRTPRGLAYAGFRVWSPQGDPIGFTAFVQGRALRLTAHDAFSLEADEAGLRWLLDLTRRWREGALYYAFEAGAGEVASGLYLGGGAPPPDRLLDAIERLQRVASALRTGAGRGLRPDWDELVVAAAPQDAPGPALPAPDLDRLLERAAAGFASEGIPLSPSGDRGVLSGRFVNSDGHRYRLALDGRDGRRLCLRASAEELAPNLTTTVVRRLNDLNGRLTIGTVAIGSHGAPEYVLALPIATTAVDRELCAWLGERAWATSAMLRRELGSSP